MLNTIDEASGQPRGEPAPLTSPASFAAHVSLSADGRRLVYSSVLESQNIQRLFWNRQPVELSPAHRINQASTLNQFIPR